MLDERNGKKRGSDPASAEPHAVATLEGMTAAWQQASNALRDSERRYRELVEYSLGLICTHDLTGIILSINPAAANSLGYRPDDGIGQNLRDFLLADKRHLFDDYLRRIADHGYDEGLMSVVARDGLRRVWMYRNVLSHHPDGSAYVLGHAIDVTDRVAVERTLRVNEQALRTAHAELEVRVAERTIDLEHANERLRVESAQREAAERSRERALIEQRDTLAFLAEFSERLAPLVTFDELVRVARALPVPFLADATLVYAVDEDGSVRRVSTRLEAADPAATIGAGCSDGDPLLDAHVVQVVATGTLAVVNDPDLSSQPMIDGPAADLVPRAIAMFPLALEDRVKAVLCLLSQTEQRYTGSGALVLDHVARRLRLALERIDLYRQADDANRLKDEFLSMLSHELRTPLNAIFGWARILQMRQLDEQTAKAVEVIQRNAEAQIRLIEEMLDLSRIITGKMALEIGVVDVGDVVRAAIDVVRPAMHAKKIHFEMRLEAVAAVRGDAHRLQQVFWNLLSNAVKFTGSAGAIAVNLRAAAGSVVFEVVDTGVGIRREVLPFIFDRFRQADSSTSRRHGGLGLGLAIVRHIVELHGGSVHAASSGEGAGATFTIQLPTTDRARAKAEGPLVTRGATDFAQSPRLRGRTVLVVEDDDDARDLIAAVLEGAGARVMVAASTREALQHLSHGRPDAVVADLGLPGEDGYALLTQIRALHPDVPAIALTAYARSTDRDRALAHGFQRHVSKPMDPQQLVEYVEALL